MPGVPDVTEFPRATYARIHNRLLRHAGPQLLTYGTRGGVDALKQALAEHLRVARSVDCGPGQVLITEGVHQAIDLVVRSLADPGDCVWMEEPGYWGRSEEHTSELQSPCNLVCRLLLEKKKKTQHYCFISQKTSFFFFIFDSRLHP